MEGITLGEIAGWLAFIASIIGSVVVISKVIAQSAYKWHKGEMKPIIDKLDDISDKLKNVEIDNCKNYIVNFLSKIEAGDMVTNDSMRRFWENYNLYQSLGGNSYVHEWVERLKAEGKLYLPHVTK